MTRRPDLILVNGHLPHGARLAGSIRTRQSAGDVPLYDQDGRSNHGAQHWLRITDRARIVHWPNLRPGETDLTDYYLAGGDLAALVAGAATSALPGNLL